MKIIVFAVAAYNLAEVSRMIEIAKKAREVFDIKFIHYGGKFSYLIEKEGFEIERLNPQLSKEKLKRIQSLLNGDAINTLAYFDIKEIHDRVKAESQYFNKVKPSAVLTGWNLTIGISARLCKVHYVNVLHSTSIQEYYQEGLQSYPDYFDNWLINLLLKPEKKTELFNKRVLTSKLAVKSYNKILKEYGLNEYENFIEYIEGDTTLLADIPEWVNHRKLRSSIHHIGPLPAQLDIPIPLEVKKIDKEKTPIVYFAMGSSGKKELIKEIIEGFKNKPFHVIAPIKSLTESIKIDIPDNVIVTGFLPAHKVNKMADVAVIHGGQNTVMNACLSGTPFIGIGMHVEQQANIDACVRLGFAIRLSKKRVTPKQVIDSVDLLLKDSDAKKKIDKFRIKLEAWDGPSNGVRILQDVLK